MNTLPMPIEGLLVLLAVAAAVFDLRRRRVPNWLTASGAALGIVLNASLFGTPGLWFSLKGLGLAFLIYLPLYVLRTMGGGDVKLMAAVGAIVGPMNWFRIFVLTVFFGAAAAIFLMLAKGRVKRTLSNIGVILKSLGRGQAPYKKSPELDVRDDRAARLPHAVAIACATLAFLLTQRA